MKKASLTFRLMHELIRAKSTIRYLRPSDCSCGSSFVLDCQRCGVDLQIESMTKLIKEAKEKLSDLHKT